MESFHENTPHVPPSSSCQPLRLREARQALKQTLYADAILFTLSQQWSAISEIDNPPGLTEFCRHHEQASNHHLTAKGCLERMAGGDWHESIIRMLVTHMYKGRHFGLLRYANLLETRRSVSQPWQMIIENGIGWLRYSDAARQDALVLSQKTVGEKRWSLLAKD
jgi:hypothetical protein